MVKYTTCGTSFVLAGIVLGMFCSCKTENVVADFAVLKSVLKEGEPAEIQNNSSNATAFEWRLSPGTWKSTDKNPKLEFDEAGTYQLELISKNRKLTSVKQTLITVLPDTMWRLTRNNSKIWYVASLVYAGSEMLVDTCQKDDEFRLVRGNMDTFSFTEGNKTCPSGTYLFEIPASGAWRYNSNKKTLEFALTAFGSPYNFEFTTTKITKDGYEGTDAKNEVVMKLKSSK